MAGPSLLPASTKHTNDAALPSGFIIDNARRRRNGLRKWRSSADGRGCDRWARERGSASSAEGAPIPAQDSTNIGRQRFPGETGSPALGRSIESSGGKRESVCPRHLRRMVNASGGRRDEGSPSAGG